MSKKRNVPLAIGWVGIIFFSVLAIFGPFIAPYSPDYEKTIDFQSGQTIVTPSPPTENHWLGKDQLGRDVMSLYLHGLPYTLAVILLVSGLRVIIGSLIGIWKGIYLKSGNQDRKKSSWFGLVSGIPAVFVMYSLLLFSKYQEFRPGPLVLFAILMMVIMGGPPVALSMERRTRQMVKQLFIQASYAFGASKKWILRKHILPNFQDRLILLFIEEMISVLNILGQLSVFHIFLGGSDIRGDEYFSQTFEWVGLLGQNMDYLIIYPWLEWVPLMLYMILLLVFYLLARGWEKRIQEKYHRYPYMQ